MKLDESQEESQIAYSLNKIFSEIIGYILGSTNTKFSNMVSRNMYMNTNKNRKHWIPGSTKN